jgi:hypothetical protein
MDDNDFSFNVASLGALKNSLKAFQAELRISFGPEK